jgi:hypothetical protein
MTIQLLPSGYWRASWSPYRFIQWPRGTAPSLEDGFGWITPADLDEARRAMEQAEQP